MEGAWALILHDKNNGGIYIGRDHIGLAPLYIGFGKNGEIFASSEMKSIQDFSNELFPLQPGSI